MKSNKNRSFVLVSRLLRPRRLVACYVLCQPLLFWESARNDIPHSSEPAQSFVQTSSCFSHFTTYIQQRRKCARELSAMWFTWEGGSTRIRRECKPFLTRVTPSRDACALIGQRVPVFPRRPHHRPVRVLVKRLQWIKTGTIRNINFYALEIARNSVVLHSKPLLAQRKPSCFRAFLHFSQNRYQTFHFSKPRSVGLSPTGVKRRIM